MKRLALLLCLFASNAYGIDYIQTHHERIPAFGSDATLTAPDPSQANESFRIPKGTTVRITGVESCKNIYIDGMGDADAVLEMMPGSELRVQTIVVAGPRAYWRTPTANSHKVVWRNLPFDLASDPQQFSNGCINISGKVLLTGDNPRESVGEVVGELKAGDRTITLARSPPSWRVGDQLWIPDTRQLAPNDPTAGQQTENFGIQAIGGNTVTLFAPLAFDHLACHAQDGSIEEPLTIGNVTQPIVWQSESPVGIRFHAIALDHARVECVGVSAIDGGRTTVAPLHNSLIRADGTQQIGENQIGRYAFWHWHGCPGDGQGEWNSILRHCSIVGSPKLGVVLHHSSHFILCDDLAIVDCAGGHFITETPNVYGFALSNSIIIGKTRGSGLRITARNGRNQAGGDHWHGGVGLGLQSAMGEFHNVDIYACNDGIGMAGFRTTTLYRPIVRGMHTDTPATRVNLHAVPYRYPFLPSSDVRVWGCVRGIETWTADCREDTERMFPGLKLIHNLQPTDFEDQEETYLDNWQIRGDFTKVVTMGTPRTIGLFFKPGYRHGVTVAGGYIGGYDAAYDLRNDEEYTRFLGTEFECPLINWMPLGFFQRRDVEWDGLWQDCTFTPVNRVSRFIDGPPATVQAFRVGRTDIRTLNRASFAIRPWRDGRDINVYQPEQHPAFTLPPIPADQAYGDWPAGVNTHQQLLYLGKPIYGEKLPPTVVQDATQFGRFWADDVTLELRLQDIERRLEALENAE